jgi:hypothetical protein
VTTATSAGAGAIARRRADAAPCALDPAGRERDTLAVAALRHNL